MSATKTVLQTSSSFFGWSCTSERWSCSNAPFVQPGHVLPLGLWGCAFRLAALIALLIWVTGGVPLCWNRFMMLDCDVGKFIFPHTGWISRPKRWGKAGWGGGWLFVDNFFVLFVGRILPHNIKSRTSTFLSLHNYTVSRKQKCSLWIIFANVRDNCATTNARALAHYITTVRRRSQKKKK
jgi:hypothetical protein